MRAQSAPTAMLNFPQIQARPIPDFFRAYFSAMSFPNPLLTRTVFVNKGGQDGDGRGTPDKPFLTIAAALALIPAEDAVENPWCVVIGPGVYAEDLTMPVNTTLLGCGTDATIIQGNISDANTAADYVTVTFTLESLTYTGGVLTINGSGSRVDALRVRNVATRGGATFVVKTYGRHEFSNVSGSLFIVGSDVYLSNCSGIVLSLWNEYSGGQSADNFAWADLFASNYETITLGASAGGDTWLIGRQSPVQYFTANPALGANVHHEFDFASTPQNYSDAGAGTRARVRLSDAGNLPFVAGNPTNWPTAVDQTKAALDQLAARVRAMEP